MFRSFFIANTLFIPAIMCIVCSYLYGTFTFVNVLCMLFFQISRFIVCCFIVRICVCEYLLWLSYVYVCFEFWSKWQKKNSNRRNMIMKTLKFISNWLIFPLFALKIADKVNICISAVVTYYLNDFHLRIVFLCKRKKFFYPKIH